MKDIILKKAAVNVVKSHVKVTKATIRKILAFLYISSVVVEVRLLSRPDMMNGISWVVDAMDIIVHAD